MSDQSRIFGTSLRGWISFTVVYTVCIMSLFGVDVKEPLYTLAGMVVAYYFGQEKGKQINQ
jgi:hypothetical protein